MVQHGLAAADAERLCIGRDASGGRGFGMLSRAVAGTRGAALVVNCPGSPGGAKEALEVIAPVLEHALDLLAGGHPH